MTRESVVRPHDHARWSRVVRCVQWHVATPALDERDRALQERQPEPQIRVSDPVALVLAVRFVRDLRSDRETPRTTSALTQIPSYVD
jgi:chromosomal replication initiation ATPase DnaA